MRSPLIGTWMPTVAVLVFAMAGLGENAHAGVVVNINQVGDDVVATGSGTMDLTDLSFSGTVSGPTGIEPNQALISVGPAPGSGIADFYSGSSVTGPTSWGSGGTTYPSSGSGDLFGVDGHLDLIAVPLGYISGSSLSGTDTFANSTLASLGLTPGTYTYTWGTGAHADTFVVDINMASVPEPSSLVLSGIAVAGLMVYMGRRRKCSGA